MIIKPKDAWQVPEEIDPECISLCQTLNRLPGISTSNSSCGHGEKPYRVWFHAKRLRDLPYLLWHLDVCHCGEYGWTVRAITDCGMSPVFLMIEGPVGEQAYKGAERIVKLFEDGFSWSQEP